jgi:hypothetical protein
VGLGISSVEPLFSAARDFVSRGKKVVMSLIEETIRAQCVPVTLFS